MGEILVGLFHLGLPEFSERKKGGLMNTLQDFRPKPTKYKTILKKYGIPVSNIAPYLGLSYPYALNLLNGISRITPEVKEKLDAIVDRLESEGGTE